MTTEPTDAPVPLAAWTHTPESIPQAGLKTARSVAADDRAEVAKALDLVALDRLDFDYTIKNAGNGVYRLTGRLKGTAVQSCVVSLEPLNATIDEEVRVEFRPDERPKERPGRHRAKANDEDDIGEDLEVDFESDIDIEPIADGRMEVGRVVFETLAAALDPYPRKPDATFDWQEKAADAGARPNPFAALAKLKKDH